MALGFIRELVHPDVNYNAKVVRYFLHALVNDSLNIRKIALRVSIFISFQHKPRFKKISVSPKEFEGGETINGVMRPGLRPDNKWLIFSKNDVPSNDSEWENTMFVHNQYYGYYCWPKKVKLYEPSSVQDTPIKRMEKMTAEEQEIYNFFMNEENVKQLIKYFSLEEKKGTDVFNAYRVIFFTVSIKMYIIDNCIINSIPYSNYIENDIIYVVLHFCK